MTSGGGKEDPTYIDDVFSIDLYKGTGATKTITNGIDLEGEGGLVWHKARNFSYENSLIDAFSLFDGGWGFDGSRDHSIGFQIFLCDQSLRAHCGRKLLDWE